jgi:hypothetical protein
MDQYFSDWYNREVTASPGHNEYENWLPHQTPDWQGGQYVELERIPSNANLSLSTYWCPDAGEGHDCYWLFIENNGTSNGTCLALYI